MVTAGALTFGLLAAGCAQDDPAIQTGAGEQTNGDHEEDAGEGHAEQGTVTIEGEEATNHGSAKVAGQDEFELELDDNYFGPTVLKGEADQTITLTLHNEGQNPHTFTVDDVNVDEELQPGDEGVTVDIAFPPSGSLTFYCRFHRGSGMLGSLSVDGTAGSGDGGTSDDDDDDGKY
jgi:plastocyanin